MWVTVSLITRNQQEWQQIPSLEALEGNMLLTVSPQAALGTDTGRFHPPAAKVYSCTSPAQHGIF